MKARARASAALESADPGVPRRIAAHFSENSVWIQGTYFLNGFLNNLRGAGEDQPPAGCFYDDMKGNELFCQSFGRKAGIGAENDDPSLLFTMCSDVFGRGFIQAPSPP